VRVGAECAGLTTHNHRNHVRHFSRVLITGIAGFAGSWLAEELAGGGYEVFGTRVAGESLDNLAGVRGQVAVRVLDLRSSRSCAGVLADIRPQAVFHLAAYSAVGASYADPDLPMRVNYGGTLNLLEAVRNNAHVRRALRVLLTVGSSDMYGRVKPVDLPITERQPLNPLSPYAISKAAADFLAATYQRAYDLPIIRVRAFNHAGPRQRAGFVIPDFAVQIARLEKKPGRRVLRTGNLAARRDITDVRDVALAYRLIAEKGKPGEVYHIGSGRAVSIESILRRMLRMSRRAITPTKDIKRMRPAEVPVLQADISKLKKLGWRPSITLGQTLADTLDYYRSRV
jgi:GDP-4-dehydro-6-deoxy-D-mannose reductase